MNGKTMTLLAILAFVALTLGSFIWFILTWDKTKEQPASFAPKTHQERIV